MLAPVSQDGSSASSMSAEEWSARVELAAFYRLTAMFGWDETVYNHISARVPGEPDAFLANPFGLLFEEIRASDLVKVRGDGASADGQGKGVNPAGFYLHSVVHEARPDVNCVMHFHSDEIVAVANHRAGLLPLCQEAMLNFATISYHPFEGILIDEAETERLVADLGDNNIMFLRNHGVLTCGGSVPAAFSRAFNMDKACKIQVATLAQGDPVLPSEQAIAQVIETFARLTGPDLGRVEFNALMRKLDRIDPSYRD